MTAENPDRTHITTNPSTRRARSPEQPSDPMATTPTSQSRRPPTGSRVREGKKPVDLVVREALRNIDDPIVLEMSPLTSLQIVKHFEKTKFDTKVCPSGLALRYVLQLTLTRIGNDLEGTPVGVLALGILAGRTQRATAKELGICPEQLSRRWKPALLRLVRHRLESLSVRVSRTVQEQHSDQGFVPEGPAKALSDSLGASSAAQDTEHPPRDTDHSTPHV